MKKQDFFKEWYEKYPKSFQKFKEYFDSLNFIGTLELRKDEPVIDYQDDYNHKIEIPFEIISGVIEKFFDEDNLHNKQKCQMAAYLNAAEILEKELG